MNWYYINLLEISLRSNTRFRGNRSAKLKTDENSSSTRNGSTREEISVQSFDAFSTWLEREVVKVPHCGPRGQFSGGYQPRRRRSTSNDWDSCRDSLGTNGTRKHVVHLKLLFSIRRYTRRFIIANYYHASEY